MSFPQKNSVRASRPPVGLPFSRVMLSLLATLLVGLSVLAGPAPQSMAQSPASGLGQDDGSVYGDAQEQAEEEMGEATPEEREEVEGLQPEEGPIEEAGDERADQQENASPEEKEAADRVDGGSEEPSTQGEAQEDGAEQAENATPEEKDDADKVDGDGSEGGLSGMAVDMAVAMLTHFWDRSFGWLGEQIGPELADALLYLPDPSGSDGVTGMYEDTTKTMFPLLLIGVLVLSLLMMLGAHNHGVSFAGLKVLPQIALVAIVLGSLPFLFGELSTLGTDLTISLLPGGGEIATAKQEMIKAILGQLVIGNFLNLILAVLGVFVLVVVAVVAFFKNIFFTLLFIAAPFALISSLIPGLSHFGSTWAKAVLICAAIPAMWAAELWLGAQLVASPQAIFGDSVNSLGFITNGMFTSIIAIIMMWIMYKTPFKALSWAFASYDSGRGGGIRSFGRWLAFTAATRGISQVAGAVSNMRSSGGTDVVPGKGGSGGPEYGAPRLNETVKQRTSWDEGPNGEVTNQRTQYDHTRTMSVDHDPNTVNMAPPQGHGPTDSGSTPYPQPGRREPGQLGEAGPSSPTIARDAEGNITVFDSPDRQPFRPRDDKEDD